MCYLGNENLIQKKKGEEKEKVKLRKNKAHFRNEATDSTFGVSNRSLYLSEIDSGTIILLMTYLI